MSDAEEACQSYKITPVTPPRHPLRASSSSCVKATYNDMTVPAQRASPARRPSTPETPRSVKRRMLSRTQSLGAISLQKSSSPSSHAVLKSSSMPGAMSPCGSTLQQVLQRQAHLSSPTEAHSVARSSRITMTRHATDTDASPALQRADELGNELELRVHSWQSEILRPESPDACRIGSSVYYEAAGEAEVDPTAPGSIPQSLSDLRSLGSGRRFVEEVGYLLEPMVARDARIEMKRAVGVDVLVKMTDDAWVAQAVACACLQDIWLSLWQARDNEVDAIFDAVALLFCFKLISSQLIAFPIADGLGAMSSMGLFLSALMQDGTRDVFQPERKNRKQLQMLAQLREVYGAFANAAGGGLAPSSTMPRSAWMTAYCVSEMCSSEAIYHFPESAKTDLIIACKGHVISHGLGTVVADTCEMAEMALWLTILSALHSEGRIHRDLNDAGFRDALVRLVAPSPLRSHGSSTSSTSSEHATCSDGAPHAVLLAACSLVALGVHASLDWAAYFVAQDFARTIVSLASSLYNDDTIASTAAHGKPTATAIDSLALLLCLLYRLAVQSTSVGLLIERSGKGAFLRDIAAKPLPGDEITSGICRGFASLIMEECWTAHDLGDLEQIGVMAAAIRELLDIHNSLHRAAEGVAGNPDRTPLTLDTARAKAALSRLCSIL